MKCRTIYSECIISYQWNKVGAPPRFYFSPLIDAYSVIIFSQMCHAVLCLVIQSCLTLCDPMDCSLPGSSVHGDSPGKNTGVGCHACPPPGDLPNWGRSGKNPGLLHCRWILYHLSHQGSPIFTVNFPKFFNHSRSVLWLLLPVLTITQIYGCNILATPSRPITHLKEKLSPKILSHITKS